MITREKYHHYDESVDYESSLDYNIPDMKEKLCYAKELLKNEDFKIVPIGTCDKVLACSEALNDKDNFFFNI